MSLQRYVIWNDFVIDNDAYNDDEDNKIKR